MRSSIRTLLAPAVVLALTAVAPAQEALPPGTKVVKVEARPASVSLTTPFAYSQLVLTGTTATGEQLDVTRLAKLAAPAAAVSVSPTGMVRPAADGSGELTFALDGVSVKVPVAVSGQRTKDGYAVSFLRDVQPAMSKMGCNAGTCHGSAEGKNGFKLSLRGYDPVFDHRALTDDLEGRRINVAAPERSLMVLKPAGAVPHVGSVLTSPGEPYYELLKSWIAGGAKFDPDSARVVSLEVQPQGPTLPLPGVKQQMAVVAKYSDGAVRDVSAEAFIESSNTEVATVDKAGLVTAVRRGEATMLARYEGAYAASTLVVMGDRSGFAWKDLPRYNFIDELVDAKLKRIKVQLSDLCSDGEFIRRIYLDLTGLPPTPEEVRAFLADGRPSKANRDELVDRLVGSDAYVEHWTNKWADLLQVNRKFLGDPGARAFRAAIREAVATNKPYDKFAYEILTASGSNVEKPEASYYKILRTPDAAMENTTHLFLAVRFNCNKCHDHPFERWTQDQYYNLAAYFAQVGRKEDPKYKGQKVGGSAVEGAQPLVEVISDTGSGDVKHDRTGQVSPPKFPFTHEAMPPAGDARRVQLAKWITAKENPYFAKSYVNRLWSYMTGVGLIEPIDDIRAGNPPSNPQLLDKLTSEFVGSGFDARHMVKLICKSRTYQLSFRTNKWNAGDDMNYSHAIARRMPAEVLYDSIHRSLRATSKLPGLPAGSRAAQLIDSNVELPGGFLELFGKPPRESACECERAGGLMLGPVMAMVNGPILGEALKDRSNRLHKLVAAHTDDAKVVEELYLATLARMPTSVELSFGVRAIRSAGEDHQRLVAEHNRKKAALEAYTKQLDGRQSAWETKLSTVPTWVVLEPTKMESKIKATLEKQADNSILVTGGPNVGPEVYTITASTKLTGITAIRLEALPDDKLPAKGPGRAPNGNFVLNEFKLGVAPEGKPGEQKPAPFAKASATFSQDSWAVAGAIDGNAQSGWAVAPEFGKAHTAMFELKQPIGVPEGTTLTFAMDQRFPGKDHNLGKFRLSVTTTPNPILAEALEPALAKLLAVPAGERTPEQKAELTRRHRAQDKEFTRLTAEASDVPPNDPRVLGAQDLAWALINNPAFLFNH